MTLQCQLAVHTMPEHDHRKEEPIRDVTQLRREDSEGATEHHNQPTNRDHRATRRAVRAPRIESFRGDRSGREGTGKKETLTPCAVHTADYSNGMNNDAPVPTFTYSLTTSPGEQTKLAALRRLVAKECALGTARKNHPHAGITSAMMTKHYEIAESFIRDLDAGKVGTTLEDRAAALAVILAGAAAGARAAERAITEKVLADFSASK